MRGAPAVDGKFDVWLYKHLTITMEYFTFGRSERTAKDNSRYAVPKEVFSSRWSTPAERCHSRFTR